MYYNNNEKLIMTNVSTDYLKDYKGGIIYKIIRPDGTEAIVTWRLFAPFAIDNIELHNVHKEFEKTYFVYKKDNEQLKDYTYVEYGA